MLSKGCQEHSEENSKALSVMKELEEVSLKLDAELPRYSSKSFAGAEWGGRFLGNNSWAPLPCRGQLLYAGCPGSFIEGKHFKRSRNWK